MRIFAATILLFLAASVCAQDVHFSQFFFAPQYLNPAEIGNFDAQYRANANQKTQWREVSQPYTTFALMGDGRLDFVPDDLAFGAYIMNDRAGDSRFNTFSILLGSSYSYDLDDQEKHAFSGGLQMGFSQIKIDRDALSFNNQYNGVVYDPNLPSGENFARNSRWYFNFNFGLAYHFKPTDKKTITLGYSGHNLITPQQSFFNETGVILPFRSSIYAIGDWNIHPQFDLLPALRFMDQGTFTEFILGSALRYVLVDEQYMYRAVFAGYFGRFGDSGIALAGVHVDDWRVGVSYDINVSELTAASRNRGGLEFSVAYLFNRGKDRSPLPHKFCPVFL